MFNQIAEPLVFQNEDGFVYYREDKNKCEIEFVKIKEDRRHRGLGTKLMKDFFNEVPQCNTFYLTAYFNPEINDEETSLDFFALVRFYETLGFEKDEVQFKELENSDSLDTDYRIFMTKIA